MNRYKYTIILAFTFLLSYPFIMGKKIDEFQKKNNSDAYMQESQMDESESEDEVGSDSESDLLDEKEEEIDNDSIHKSDNESVEESDEALKGDKKESEAKDKTDSKVLNQEEKEQLEKELASFSNTLFIGDSRTVGLSEYADLKEADVFATTGMSVYKLFDTKVKCSDGKERDLENILKMKKYSRIYIMIGINELGYDFTQTVDKYSSTIDIIQSYQPDATFILGANLHVSKRKSDSDKIYNNKKINKLNKKIKEISEEKDCYYLDINEKFDDNEGNLDKNYTSDDAHVYGKYYQEWADWLRKETKNIIINEN